MEKMELGRIETTKGILKRTWYQLKEDSIDWWRFSISLFYTFIWCYILIKFGKAFSFFIASEINPAWQDSANMSNVVYTILWATILIYATCRISVHRKYHRKEYKWIPKERQEELDKYI